MVTYEAPIYAADYFIMIQYIELTTVYIYQLGMPIANIATPYFLQATPVTFMQYILLIRVINRRNDESIGRNTTH